MKHALLLPLIVAALVLPRVAAAEIAGNYANPQGVRLEIIAQAADTWSGAIHAQGQVWPLQVAFEDEMYVGAINANGEISFISFELIPGGIRMETDEFFIDFQRQAAAPNAPQQQPAPQAPQAPEADLPQAPAGGIGGALAGGPATPPAAAPGENWKTFEHPTGGYFQYPPDWQLAAQGNLLALVPPDFDTNREFMCAFGEQVTGIASPADPQVGAYLDNFIRQAVPDATRGQPAAAASRAGQGAVYNWTGNAAGKPMKARVYVVFLGDFAVAFGLVGDDEKFAARSPVMDRVFASLGQGQPKLDQQLVGTWRQSASSNSGVDARGDMVYFNETITYTFAADGSAGYTRRTRGGFTNNQNQGPAPDANLAGNDNKRGTWAADGNALFLRWNDGTGAEHAYGFVDGRLVFRDEQGKMTDNFLRAE